MSGGRRGESGQSSGKGVMLLVISASNDTAALGEPLSLLDELK